MTTMMMEVEYEQPVQGATCAPRHAWARVPVEPSPSERLANDPDVREFYLGMGGAGEAKSFKDIKHYKRRKRWLS